MSRRLFLLIMMLMAFLLVACEEGSDALVHSYCIVFDEDAVALGHEIGPIRTSDDIRKLENIECVVGDLSIVGSELDSLAGLESLKQIEGGLAIRNNYALNSLRGLNNLTLVSKEFDIENNPSLTSLGGLDNLIQFGRLMINNNDALTSLNGLSDDLTVPGGALIILNNDALTSISALSSLTRVNATLTISDNPALTTLSGLDSLSSVGTGLIISNNDSLTSLTRLSGLNVVSFPDARLEISNNDVLRSLRGLENVMSLDGNVAVYQNNLLPACEAENFAIQLGRTCTMDSSSDTYCVNNNGTGTCD